MVRLIAEDAGVTVLAFISLGDGGRLAVASALKDFASYAVASYDSEERIRHENILKRNFHMVAMPGAAPVIKGDEGAIRGVDGAQMISNVTRTHKGRAAWMAAKVHQPAHGESDDAWRFEIPIRAGETKSGDALFVIDFFNTEACADCNGGALVANVPPPSAGEIRNVRLSPAPAAGAVQRLRFEYAPSGSGPVDLLAQLTLNGKPVSDTWIFRWAR